MKGEGGVRRCELRLRASDRGAVGDDLSVELAAGLTQLLLEEIVLPLRGDLVGNSFVIRSLVFIELLTRQPTDLVQLLIGLVGLFRGLQVQARGGECLLCLDELRCAGQADL